MKFDDFNYEVYNPYILIEDTTNAGPQTKAALLQLADGGGGTLLSHGALEQQMMDAYQFGTLSLKSAEEEKKEEEEKKKAEEDAKVEKSVEEKKAETSVGDDGVVIQIGEHSEETTKI